jgi:hypothetical protein
MVADVVAERLPQLLVERQCSSTPEQAPPNRTRGLLTGSGTNNKFLNELLHVGAVKVAARWCPLRGVPQPGRLRQRPCSTLAVAVLRLRLHAHRLRLCGRNSMRLRHSLVHLVMGCS